MKARAVLVVAGSVLVVIVLAVAATTTSPRIVGGPPQLGLDVSDRTVEPPTAPTVRRLERPTPSDREAPDAVSITFGIIVLGAVAAFVGFAIARAIEAWRNRPRLVWRRDHTEWGDVEVHDAGLHPVVAGVAADADAQREALTRGSARNAIVECWLRLEMVVADAGIPHRPSDTSMELTERVLADSAVDPAAISQLSALYREARFSTHPMGEAERATAATALDAVHAGLRAGSATSGRGAGPARAATAAS